MGIIGFTKYIYDREQLYFENYDLRDCNLLIDGHSISCQLYNWKHWLFDSRSWNVYGGDYDKYAYIVENFFGMLKEVNVTPYVIFDGGYEQRKIPTILKRMTDKLQIAAKMNPEYETENPGKVVFPVWLRECFKDVLRNLDVKVAMCEYEGDQEIASIARLLDCPVLTFDSDYFIYGAQYIPFTSLDCRVRAVEDWRNGPYKCISCKLYKIEKFLEDYPGLTKDTLQLLPVFLGNDYIGNDVLAPFLKSINLDTHENLQEKIKAILDWLKGETLESAIRKVLDCFKSNKEKICILKKVQKIISGYDYVESQLLKYLKIKSQIELETQRFDFEALEEEILNDSENIEVPEDEEMLIDTHLEVENPSKNSIPKIFKENFTKCQYPSSFMNIITQNKYFCIEQVENHEKEHAHSISLHILRAIHKILTDSSGSDFIVIARGKGTNIEQYPQEEYTLKVPSLEEIEHTPLQGRKDFILNILEIEPTFVTLLDHFPVEWHLFLISLKYASSKTILETPLIYSIVLCFIILNYIDQKVGYYRSFKRFQKRYLSFMQTAGQINEHVPFRVDKNCFYYFTLQDCMILMNKMVKFFVMDPKDAFDVNLVHCMSEVQSAFLHVKYLNSLLKYPYPNFVINTTFDGTFIYNLTKAFKDKAHELENNYLNVFFKESPSVLAGLKYVLNLLNKSTIFKPNV